MKPESFEKIVSTLRLWDNKGLILEDDGTQIIARVPHIAPVAYFH